LATSVSENYLLLKHVQRHKGPISTSQLAGTHFYHVSAAYSITNLNCMEAINLFNLFDMQSPNIVQISLLSFQRKFGAGLGFEVAGKPQPGQGGIMRIQQALIKMATGAFHPFYE
jgi:hypothetical protein